jgi:hypothetical protein
VPYAKAAATLPISPLAHPTRANRYHKPTSEPKHNGCASGFPLMAIAPASPNNDLTSNKIIAQLKNFVCSPVRLGDVSQRPDQTADNKMNEGTLTPCSTEGLPSMVVETKMGCCRMNIVSKETTSTIECSPHAIAGPKIAYTSQAWPMQAESCHRPADESFVKGCCHIVNETSRQTTLTPCLPQPEPSAPPPSGSPASPNNDPLSNKITSQLSPPSKKAWENIRGEMSTETVNEPTRSSEETPTERDPFEPKPPNATDTPTIKPALRHKVDAQGLEQAHEGVGRQRSLA